MMRRLGAGCVAILGIAVVSSMPRSAHACSAPFPWPSSRIVYPASDAIAPTNVVVRIAYGGDSEGPPLRDVMLRPVGGEPVEITTALGWETPLGLTVLVTPVNPLVVNTDYEVLDRIEIPCSNPECVLDDYTVIGTFRTGAGPDSTPPVFEGLAGIATSGLDSCNDGACCGPYRILFGTLDWTPAVDDDTPAGEMRYALFDADDNLRATIVGGDMLPIAYCCSCEGSLSVWDFAGAVTVGREVYARAIDLAGNMDDNRRILTWEEPCNPTDADGADGGGCGCDVGGQAGGGEPFSLIGLLFAMLVATACSRIRCRRSGRRCPRRSR